MKFLKSKILLSGKWSSFTLVSVDKVWFWTTGFMNVAFAIKCTFCFFFLLRYIKWNVKLYYMYIVNNPPTLRNIGARSCLEGHLEVLHQ